MTDKLLSVFRYSRSFCVIMHISGHSGCFNKIIYFIRRK